MPKYVVRHGVMRNLGVFASRGSDVYARGAQVIARTSRGLEAGEVLCEANELALANLHDPKNGQILRERNDDDAGELRRLLEQEQHEHATCQRHIDELQLDMQLVDVEHLYGGERVVIYYLAEDRVDFRQLVKNLATEFQTRIEMQQIGVRDEAKLLADYGDCGKPVCCNTHLSEMPPVSMRMAKLQKATLDPSKISGRCGRLKCCLRYEYDTYQELQKDLPPVGAEIITSEGTRPGAGTGDSGRADPRGNGGHASFGPRRLGGADGPEKGRDRGVESEETASRTRPTDADGRGFPTPRC